MRFSKNKDLISGLFLLVAAAIYFALSFQIRLTNIDRVVGSRLFPQMCGVLMMLFGAMLVAGNLRERFRNTGEGADAAEETAPAPKPVYRNTVLVLASFALYIYLMDLIGFTASTLAYLFSQMLVLHPGKASPARVALYAVLSVVATVSIYYMFNNVFRLLLPKGAIW